MEIALRFNPTNGNTTSNSPLCGDGGLILDASKNWRSENDINTGASLFQRALSQNSFQFFNCDMHYSEPAVFMLIKSLQHTSIDEREQFFLSTVGCRRRMDRKWQETPLQKALMVEDEFIGMKQRAMFLYIKRGIENNRLTLWEAFNIFDCIDSGTIAPEELWGH